MICQLAYVNIATLGVRFASDLTPLSCEIAISTACHELLNNYELLSAIEHFGCQCATSDKWDMTLSVAN